MFTSLQLRRRAFRGALIAGAAAASIGVLAGPAGADTYASAPVQYHNGSCGKAISGAPAIGAAYFHRQGGNDIVDFQLQTGTPSTAYSIQLWDTASCTIIATLGTMNTNAWGNGELVASTFTGATHVFATAQDGVSYNDTVGVSL
jgi:hypothetical protein